MPSPNPHMHSEQRAPPTLAPHMDPVHHGLSLWTMVRRALVHHEPTSWIEPDRGSRTPHGRMYV